MDFLTLSFFYGKGKTNENDLSQKLNSDLGTNGNDMRDNVRVVNERDCKAVLFSLPQVRESRKRKRSGTTGRVALKKKNFKSCGDQIKVNEESSQYDKINSGITCAQEINKEPSSYGTAKKFFKNSPACRESNRCYKGFCSSQKFRAKSKLGSELFKRISRSHKPLSGSEIYVGDKSKEENNAMHSSIDDGEHQVRESSGATDSSEEIHVSANDCVKSSKSTSFEKKDKQFTQLKLTGDGKVLKLDEDSPSNSLSPRRCTRNATFKSRDQSQQMLLDFGQKMDGPIQCDVCGLTYNKYERHDEQFHAKYHKRCLSILRFNISSKDRILQSFSDGGVIVVLLEADKTWAKVTEIKKRVDSELGFVIEKKSSIPCKAFLYVKENQVIGFCMAQAVQQGYKMVHKSSSDDDDQISPTEGKSQPFCCSKVPEVIKCGINRIWVAKNERRKGVATRILDVVRGHFALGLPLSKTDIAFSDPTPDGMSLAAKYTESPNFLVYSNSGQ